MRIFIAFLIATSAACGVSAGAAIEPARPGPAPSFLRGQIQNDRGVHLEGLSVLAISLEQGSARTGLTDDKGTFIINDLKAGSYRLVVLRGSAAVWEQRHEHRSAARDVHFTVPTLVSDTPSDRPIVDRALVRSTAR